MTSPGGWERVAATPPLARVEGLPHRGIVDFGVMPGHIGAGMAEQFLHDVLGDA